MIRRIPLWSSTLPVQARYGVAVMLVALSWGLTGLLSGYLEPVRALFFAAAVTLAAWTGGRGPGVASGVLSGAILYALLIRAESLPAPYVMLPGVVLMSLGYLVGSLTQAMRAALRDQQQLVQEVRKQSADAHASEERQRIALQAGSMGAWEWQVDAGRVHWSDTLERIHGLEPGTFDGSFEAYQSDMHPEDRDRVLATIQRSLAGDPHALRYRIIRPDGEVRWLAAQGQLVVGSDGSRRLVGVCTDVTEQHRAEEAKSFVAEASRILSGSLTLEVILTNVARMAVPALADWCAVDLLDGEARESEPVPHGRLRRLAVEHRDPDKVVLARMLHERYPSDPNAPVGPWAVLRTGEPVLVNVTDEMLAASARGEEHLSLIRSLGLRSAMLVPLEARGRVHGVLTLVSAESGRRFEDSDLAVARDLGRRAGMAIENARLLKSVNDSRELLEQQAAELEAQTEELVIAQEQLESINQELRLTNESLLVKTELAEQARREAQEANRAKAQFLAVMSHELRTPLNAISGYVELMQMGLRGPLTDEQRRDLARIEQSQAHLLALINNVLSFAKVEAGQLELDIRPVEIDDLLRDVQGMMEALLNTRGLRFKYLAPPGPVAVQGDAEKVRQIVVNLLSNSIKFTPSGGEVTLRCDVDEQSVLIHVVDTGPGIPPDKTERVFEPFVQLANDLAGRANGTGLGLAIARDLARRMGGDITLESRLGAGSTFSVQLPRAAPVMPSSDLPARRDEISA